MSLLVQKALMSERMKTASVDDPSAVTRISVR